MSDAWLGFFGGLVAALVGGLIASVVQRQNAMREKTKQAQVEAYFQLLDLNAWYFWVTTAELHGEEPKPEVLANCRRLALQLNDKLRAFERLDMLEDILIVLFSESIPTAAQRAKLLDDLLSRYGKIVAPRYSAIMQRISTENLLRHTSSVAPPNNAPAAWRYAK